MNVLGSFGNLYMAALLILLAAGVLYAIYYLIHKIYALATGKDRSKGKAAPKRKGGGDFIMKNSNGWLKLALFSFVGLIIAVVLLNVTNPSNNTSEADQHRAHVNGTAVVGGTVQGTMNGGVTMDQMNNIMQQMGQLQQQMMQMQQQYTGQMGSSMGNSGSMGSSGGMMDDKDMMDQMNQMNNMNNMNNNNSNSSGGGMSMM